MDKEKELLGKVSRPKSRNSRVKLEKVPSKLSIKEKVLKKFKRNVGLDLCQDFIKRTIDLTIEECLKEPFSEKASLKTIAEVEKELEKYNPKFCKLSSHNKMKLINKYYEDNPPKEVVVHRELETFRKSFIKTIEEISNNWFGEDDFDNDEIEQIKNKGARNALLIIKNKFDKELKSLISTFKKVESKPDKYKLFHDHIKTHLEKDYPGFPDMKVICKICEKDIDTIYEEYLKSNCSEKGVYQQHRNRENKNVLENGGSPSEKQLDKEKIKDKVLKEVYQIIPELASAEEAVKKAIDLTIEEYFKERDKWIDEARKIWGVKGFIDTQKLLDFTEKLSKEKKSGE